MSFCELRTATFSLLIAGVAHAESLPAIGTPAAPEQIVALDSDVRADGAGLPAGQGSVAEGAAIFAATCAACHSVDGKPSTAPPLAGGNGSLATAHSIKTIGSYWPYAPTVFDYIRRAMPFNAPRSLSDNQVYAVTAFLLNANGLIPADAVMNRTTLPAVRMPNANGFRNVWLEQQKK